MFKGPAGSLFDLVVVAAERGEVAQAGLATVVVGKRVVVIALGRRPSAGGEHAGGVAELDKMP